MMRPSFPQRIPLLVWSCLVAAGFYTKSMAQSAGDFKTEGIATVLAHPAGRPNELPVVRFDATGGLRFAFDDLYQRAQVLQYTYILCSWDWVPSDLMSSDYLRGYLQEPLPSGQIAFNTYVPYTHFEANLPTSGMRPSRSGNYLLVVFEDDPAQPILTQRVVFFEELAAVGVDIHRSLTPETQKTHQEVDFTVGLNQYPVPQPFQDLRAVIYQNLDFTAQPKTLTPRFVRTDLLDFNFDNGENQFPGVHEFREWDTKNTQVPSLFVRRFDIVDGVWNAYVATEPMRGLENYLFKQDADGAVIPRKQNANPGLEADYLWVDLALEDLEKTGQRKIYVVGGFNGFQPRPEDLLVYDPSANQYRGKILSKQGYYNYWYVEKTDDGWDYSVTEGNHWETQNTYTVLVYHREWVRRYDRVIGVSTARFPR